MKTQGECDLRAALGLVIARAETDGMILCGTLAKGLRSLDAEGGPTDSPEFSRALAILAASLALDTAARFAEAPADHPDADPELWRWVQAVLSGVGGMALEEVRDELAAERETGDG